MIGSMKVKERKKQTNKTTKTYLLMFRRAPYTYKRIILKKEDRAMFAFDLDLQKKRQYLKIMNLVCS